jgi:hypothetical protein
MTDLYPLCVSASLREIIIHKISCEGPLVEYQEQTQCLGKDKMCYRRGTDFKSVPLQAVVHSKREPLESIN